MGLITESNVSLDSWTSRPGLYVHRDMAAEVGNLEDDNKDTRGNAGAGAHCCALPDCCIPQTAPTFINVELGK